LREAGLKKMSSHRAVMGRIIRFLVTFLLFGNIPVFAHGDKTPFSVLKDMKQKKSGPYASPFIMGDKTLVKDWLGIQVKDVSDSGSRPGVLILEVQDGSVADEEGLEKGDLIIGINSSQIRNEVDLEKYLEEIEKPDVFTFHLVRDNDEEDEEVYLDNNLAEMDEEMTALIMSKTTKGGFEKGMLMEDMMARSPLGSMDGQGGVISPQAIMQQMMAQTPMGKRGTFPDNMKDVDLTEKKSLSDFAKDAETRIALRLPKNKPGDSIFQKATYQLAIDRKIKMIENRERLKGLALSADQKEKITKLNRIMKKYMIKQDALLAVARLDLEGALEGSSTDQATNDSLVENYQKLQQEKYIQLVRFVVEFEQILDKKQKDTFRFLAQ
jgi:hypothetical protein